MGWNRTASLHGRLEGGTEMFSPSAVSTPSVDPVHSCHKSGCLARCQSITAENTPITFKRASLAMPRRWAVLHGSQADESESLPRRRGRGWQDLPHPPIRARELRRQVHPDAWDEGLQEGAHFLVTGRVGGLKIDMTIWDIMGQKGFRELLKEAYFYGARG